MEVQMMLEEIKKGIILSEEKILSMLEEENLRDLLWVADSLREHFKDTEVFTCSIINAKSGHCSENCAFCAQSGFHSASISTYPLLSVEKLVEEGIKRAEEGATYYSFVTSGNVLSMGEMEQICEAGRELKQRTSLMLCASLGQLNRERAAMLKDAGFTRYHHNLETAESFFPQICSTHSYKEDLQTIEVAKGAGLEVCSGGIMGLGEQWHHRLELALTLREMGVDSIPINFLNPIPGTRLEKRTPLDPLEALLCICLFRIINPSKDITICGGREITLRDLQSWVFLAGANGLMIGNYLTTLGRDVEMDIKLIKDLGFSLRGALA